MYQVLTKNENRDWVLDSYSAENHRDVEDAFKKEFPRRVIYGIFENGQLVYSWGLADPGRVYRSLAGNR